MSACGKKYHKLAGVYNASAKRSTKACKPFNQRMCTNGAAHPDQQHIYAHCLAIIDVLSPTQRNPATERGLVGEKCVKVVTCARRMPPLIAACGCNSSQDINEDNQDCPIDIAKDTHDDKQDHIMDITMDPLQQGSLLSVTGAQPRTSVCGSGALVLQFCSPELVWHAAKPRDNDGGSSRKLHPCKHTSPRHCHHGCSSLQWGLGLMRGTGTMYFWQPNEAAAGLPIDLTPTRHTRKAPHLNTLPLHRRHF